MLSLLLALLANKIYTNKMLILDLIVQISQSQNENIIIFNEPGSETEPFGSLCGPDFDVLVKNYEKLSESLKKDLRIKMDSNLGSGKAQEFPKDYPSKDEVLEWKEKLNLLKESTYKLSWEVKKTEENMNRFISEEKDIGNSEVFFWIFVGLLITLSLFCIMYLKCQWDDVKGLGIGMTFWSCLGSAVYGIMVLYRKVGLMYTLVVVTFVVLLILCLMFCWETYKDYKYSLREKVNKTE